MKVTTHEQHTYGANQPLVPEPARQWRVRLAAISLAVAGLLFVLYPALRPFSDEASLQGAAAFASPRWVLAHVLAMLGFILLALGLVGVHLALQRTPAERLAFWAMIVSWLGIGLTLPFYGAEAFALHAIGQEALRRQDATLVSLANGVRFGPGFPQIIIGLLLLALGTILVAVAIWRSRIIAKWSGIALALAFALYIPQFVASQPIRVAHGVLVAVGCLWLAAALWWPRVATAKVSDA
jgi:hypothetical protein